MILIAEQTWSVFMCCLSSFLEGSLNCFKMFVVAGGGREKNRSYLNYRLILCSSSASINQTSFPTHDLHNYQDTWSVFNCLSFFSWNAHIIVHIVRCHGWWAGETDQSKTTACLLFSAVLLFQSNLFFSHDLYNKECSSFVSLFVSLKKVQGFYYLFS